MIEARDQVDASLLAERLIAKLSTTFGLLALALAAVGLYGLIAYATAQRAGEIGIRMALGAQRRHVRRLVLSDTVKLLIFGAVLGIPIALAGAYLISSQLYEVKPTDLHCGADEHRRALVRHPSRGLPSDALGGACRSRRRAESGIGRLDRRALSRLANGIRALLRRGIADEELNAELHAFPETAVDEKMRSAMSGIFHS